jgi:membrane associated rhomboid family serine protease
MLIPLKHEQMSARRWPYVTFALIALNVIAFILTDSAIDDQQRIIAPTKLHLLVLAGTHPELQLSGEPQTFVEKMKASRPELWKEIQDPHRRALDSWEEHVRELEFDSERQAEMDSLAETYRTQVAGSIIEKYAFSPSARRPISYLTSNFLHGGWMHLIGNMWFLWLAGFVLEDAWGRPLYAAFYLIAGIAANQFYAWTAGADLMPTIGASGAVAGLMGAFLMRFPKLKIEMAWLFGFRLYKFKMAAYWLLPLWLGSEVLYGSLFGESTGVAHWAHVGGFLFGMAAAFGIQHSGIEHKMNQAIEEEISISAAPEITHAMDELHQKQFDSAIGTLNAYLAKTPDSLEAQTLLTQAYWRKSDISNYLESAVKTIASTLRANSLEAALQLFDEYVKAGGDRSKLTTIVWMKLARAAESLQQYDLALREFDLLARERPAERQSVEALMAQAKIYLKKLNEPQRALELYTAASQSKLPLLDVMPMIDAGIRDSRAALGSAASASR